MSYTTIYNVLPALDLSNPIAQTKKTEDVKQYLAEMGRTAYTTDELVFILLLDEEIRAFTKAKEMLGRGRFTVQYMNAKAEQSIPKLGDFSIIPIKHTE